MAATRYFGLVREMKSAYSHRLRLVESARDRGIKPTARLFATTVPTVRKWIRRYQQQGPSGLLEQSRAPHQQPRRTPASLERQVVALRQTLPTFGSRRLIREFDLPDSHRALERIWRQHGLMKTRRSKYQRKQDLAAIRARRCSTANTCASHRLRTLTRAMSKPFIASKKMSSLSWNRSPAGATSSPKRTPTDSTSTSCAPTLTKTISAPGRSSSGSLLARPSNFACFHRSSWITTSMTPGDTMSLGFPTPASVRAAGFPVNLSDFA